VRDRDVVSRSFVASIVAAQRRLRSEIGGSVTFSIVPFLLACDGRQRGRGAVMEVRIGIVQSMKEIEVVLPRTPSAKR